jgi:hypothetical protein
MQKTSFLLSLLLFAILAMAQTDAPNKVATVQMKRGNVKVINPDGSEFSPEKGEWISEGALVKTEAKSVLKLSFIDKSVMSVGPNSEMKIEKFSTKEPGMINVLKGSIRSQVSKNYLDIGEDKSKLFVKSKSAVMGIRGTDFTTNVKRNGDMNNILYSGKISVAQLDPTKAMPNNLDLHINKSGVTQQPGQVVNLVAGKKIQVANLNKVQFAAMKLNENFDEAPKSTKSTAPAGLETSTVTSVNLDSDKGAVKLIPGVGVIPESDTSVQISADGGVSFTDKSLAVSEESGKLVKIEQDGRVQEVDISTGDVSIADAPVKSLPAEEANQVKQEILAQQKSDSDGNSKTPASENPTNNSGSIDSETKPADDKPVIKEPVAPPTAPPDWCGLPIGQCGAQPAPTTCGQAVCTSGPSTTQIIAPTTTNLKVNVK